MVAIVEAVNGGEIPDAEVVVVISDKADAAGLEKAKQRGVETVEVERNGRRREEHDAEIISELQGRGVELVCLAGYMRLLSAGFISAFWHDCPSSPNVPSASRPQRPPRAEPLRSVAALRFAVRGLSAVARWRCAGRTSSAAERTPSPRWAGLPVAKSPTPK